MIGRVRIRGTISQHRELFLDTFYNVSQFASQGLPVVGRWDTSVTSTFEGWWLDPRGKDFGENAKYFTLGDRKKDIAEARSLLSAAGYKDGLSFEHVTYPISPSQQTSARREPG